VNAFARLGLDPRPWLEPGAVRAAQQAVLQRAHPDVAGEGGGAGDEAQEANEAARRLATASGVLREFLEMHGQAPPSAAQAVPPDLADAFMALAGPLRRAVELQREAEACETFLDRAALAEPALDVLQALQDGQRMLAARQEAIHRQVRAWTAGAAAEAPWESWRRAALDLAFLERWSRDVEERAFQMAGLAAG